MAQTDVLETTFHTVFAYIILLCIGGWLGTHPKKNPYLSKPIVQGLSRLLVNVLLSSLAFVSLGSELSNEEMSNAWPVIPWTVLNIAISSIFGAVMNCIFQVPPKFRRDFLVGMAFSNSGGLPLLLIETLSRQAPIADIPGAEKKLVLYVFMYVVPWIPLYFGPGAVFMESGWENRKEGDSKPGAILKRMFLSPIVVAALLGVLVGMTPALQNLVFGEDAPLRSLSSALFTVAKPAIGIITLCMASSLGNFLSKFRSLYCRARPSSDQEAAIEEGKTEGREANGDTETTPALSVEEGVTGEARTTETQTGEAEDSEGAASGEDPDEVLPLKTILGFGVMRMLLLPVVLGYIVIALGDRVIPDTPDRRLVKMMLLLQAGMPSADTTVVLLQGARRFTAAENIAALYLVQYALLLIPLCVLISYGLQNFF